MHQWLRGSKYSTYPQCAQTPHTHWTLIYSILKGVNSKGIQAPLALPQEKCRENWIAPSSAPLPSKLYFSMRLWKSALGWGRVANYITDPYSGYYQCKFASLKKALNMSMLRLGIIQSPMWEIKAGNSVNIPLSLDRGLTERWEESNVI